MGCRSVATPLPLNCRLYLNDSPAYSEPEAYRRLVGRLLYLNLTRPDITYVVQQLSQFVATPSEFHWNAAIHVLKYLKGCPSLGLFYPAATPLTLTAFSDADWGTCPDTRRCLTGYCILLGDSLISWRCKKQATVSVSSAEAEYRALSTTVREMLWLSRLCSDFQVTLPLPLPLYCDNQAAIHITKNQVFHERTKHLDIDCHLVRDQYKSGFLVPLHLPTDLQPADLFTKSLGGPRFRRLLSKLGLVDLHHGQLEGG
ncbi:secreted RxLR effector protein 161-like [Salvia miltiorrhiza]|uniref:secreted RxLR effector protein 161-like n=1 Tax=Salvia miltiorrhiza TaxID=226208 RepID=UPI0025ACDE56|nr:secreted RxLR effector protein 161-like [Salvia miltiorrhiza]